MFRKIGIGCLALVGLVVVLIVVIIVAVAAFGNKSSSTASSPKTGHIGTKISIPGNLDVTLLSAHAKGKQPYDDLKPGNVWLVTSWKFYNPQGDTTDVAPTGFKAQSAGVVRQPEYFSTLDNNLLDVAGTQLASKGSTTGDILFQVKKNSPVSIVYAPDVFDSGKKAVWKLHD